LDGRRLSQVQKAVSHRVILLNRPGLGWSERKGAIRVARRLKAIDVIDVLSTPEQKCIGWPEQKYIEPF
jgi:hypothetical protein